MRWLDLGSTAAAITSCMRRVSLQKVSSPKVSSGRSACPSACSLEPTRGRCRRSGRSRRRMQRTARHTRRLNGYRFITAFRFTLLRRHLTAPRPSGFRAFARPVWKTPCKRLLIPRRAARIPSIPRGHWMAALRGKGGRSGACDANYVRWRTDPGKNGGHDDFIAGNGSPCAMKPLLGGSLGQSIPSPRWRRRHSAQHAVQGPAAHESPGDAKASTHRAKKSSSRTCSFALTMRSLREEAPCTSPRQ